MTFDQQVRWSRRWGLRLMLIGSVAFAVAVGAHRWWVGPGPTPLGLAEGPMLAICGGLFLFLVGGWVRGVHRRVILKLVVPNEFWRRASLWHPLLRNWAWVDEAGKDRDA